MADDACVGPPGTVVVNGKPVEDMVALEDGTEVYTLERFLEENKNRLDEAFHFLSKQMEASALQHGRYYALSPCVRSWCLTPLCQYLTFLDHS